MAEKSIPFKSITQHQTTAQLFRYGLIGILTNSLGYFVYLLITYFGTEPKITMSVLYLLGAVIGFFGNRKWTFAHQGALLKSSVRYFMAHVCGYLINLFLLVAFVDNLGYAHQWIQAIAIIIVAGFLFFAFKYFVFRDVRYK